MRRKKVDVSENEPIILPDKATADKGKVKSYTVKTGDTIQSIAVQLGVNWEALAKFNGISSPYALNVGQTLKILLQI